MIKFKVSVYPAQQQLEHIRKGKLYTHFFNPAITTFQITQSRENSKARKCETLSLCITTDKRAFPLKQHDSFKKNCNQFEEKPFEIKAQSCFFKLPIPSEDCYKR